jgi:acetylornithine aminotransferase/acetylornithine/N-succinyldiaminopimelate aminotransferase
MTTTASRPASQLEAVKSAEARLLLPTYERYPVLVTHGRGVYLFDDTGRRYLDFLSGIGVNALGHAHPAIRKALLAQAAKALHVSNLFYHEHQAALAERLTRLSGLDRAFFCNSGTEAWEGALKLARAYAQGRAKKGKPAWRILALEQSFHGRTMGALSTTSTKKYRAPFEPLIPGVRFARFNDVADLKRKFDASVCAIALEPLQGEGGIHPVTAEFIQVARALTQKTGALLLCDEIQCGLGRTGLAFAFQQYGVKPDVVTVAKPLASGLPLGAILTTEAVSQAFHPGMHGTTFGGGPLACAVAVAFLDTLAETGLLRHINEIGEYFKGRLSELAAKHSCVREVRGAGLMLGMEVDTPERAKAVFKQLLEGGIICNRTHEVVLRFLPPYIITSKHVDAVIRALDTSLASSAADAGDSPPEQVAPAAKRQSRGRSRPRAAGKASRIVDPPARRRGKPAAQGRKP